MSRWFAEARRQASDPPPEAAKAVEWITDNEYVIRRAIREVRRDMPARFYRKLPRLAQPEHGSLPRIYLVAHGALDATEIHPGLESLAAFVSAYQEGGALTIAELWAFPTMLRLACLETLVSACGELLPGLEAPAKAAARSNWLAGHDCTECVVRAITALSALSAIPWKDFFDRTSLVDAALRRDPTGVYAEMDFESRDLYRRAVEDLARGSRRGETEVVEQAIARSTRCRDDPRRGHVGHWLVGSGRGALEAELGYRAPPSTWIRRGMAARPRQVYFGALVVFALAALVLPAAILWSRGAGAPAFVGGQLLSLVPAGIISVTFTHWLVTLILPPRILPKLDFADGLPEAFHAAVAVPVIFRTAGEVGRLLDQIETNWLTNPVANLGFVILGDFADAPTASLPEDAAILAALRSGIERLNGRYPDRRPFVLLHRQRRLNTADGIWMGWERKRGKLSEFNDFLASGDGSAFPLRAGDADALVGTRFVITTDADTVLPPGAAQRLLGALAHPLNRAKFADESGKVTEGYTFIQPRVEIAPEAGIRSLFTRLYTGDTAIDIYSRAVSDVYQDLFGEGIFTGKGGYDVAAYRRATEGRVPENAILSHDLFEGLHGRTALASDIVLYEDFPSGYLGYARRAHRWIRGDWQLLPWLAGRVPGAEGERHASRFGLLDRWRIADNLRRSLIAPGLVLLAVAGWLALPGPAWLWTLLTIAAPGAYLLTDLVTGLARGRRRGAVRGRLRAQADQAGRWALAVAFMLDEAVLALDAIIRSLWRTYGSRRQMLEWTTAAHAARANARGAAGYWREMRATPFLALVIGLYILAVAPAAVPGALPLLALWFASPAIAARIGRPFAAPAAELDAEERAFLRRLARRTWYFFEAFSGPEDNWLPPDNVQFDPRPEIAHRTSPTNTGMLLVSALTARDLGYSGLRDFAVRVRAVLDSMERMERHRGHWLNWYDTRSLAPLAPRYVSTVDSGNLAVSLVTLAEGCRDLAGRAVLPGALWAGLADAVDLLDEALADVSDRDAGEVGARVALIRRRVAGLEAGPPASLAVIDALRDDVSGLKPLLLEALPDSGPAPAAVLEEARIWIERIEHHLDMMRSEVEALLPWLEPLERPLPGLDALARRLAEALGPDRPLRGINARIAEARRDVATARAETDAGGQAWLDRLDAALDAGGAAQVGLLQDLEAVAARATSAADGMDFGMLFDRERRLFNIGYILGSDQLDPHYYDLLLSEARLASYFAIAKRDVPAEHWFHLGRPVSGVAGELTALSWNGSMFEFLMPPLFLRSEEGRLIGRSERAAVAVQKAYADRLGLPWGVSESAFALRDSAQTYQYQAFGVPGLGLKRGLGDDYVVAPYASGLALAVAPREAVRNLRALAAMGILGPYGLFEAVDFTPERQRAGERFTPVESHMAHHQGMMLAAIGNRLTGDALQRRFLSDRRMRSIKLLLQERVPWEAPREPAREEAVEVPELARGAPLPDLEVWEPRRSFPPESQFLGNGRLLSTVTTEGASALSWPGHALTRSLTHGAVEDSAGVLYLQDLGAGAIWRLGKGGAARAAFHAHMVELHHREAGIGATLEIYVAPRDDVEVRRLTLVNASDDMREIAVTSAAEVVLARREDHERHPAFSRLFVRGEYLPDERALLFSRRPRRAQDRPPILLHRIHGDGTTPLDVSFETDRATFLGREGSAALPEALAWGRNEGLGGTEGYSLDPVMALQGRVRLDPGARCRIAFTTIAAGSRETALELSRRYGDHAAFDWTLDAARRAAAVEAGELSLSHDDLVLAQTLGSRLLISEPQLRAPRPVPWDDLGGQPDLWSMGLSGDLPILVLGKADDVTEAMLTKLVQIHRWWRRREFSVDLVVLREGAAGYEEPIRQQLTAAMREAGIVEGVGERAGIHLCTSGQIGAAALRALRGAARLWIDGSRGSLADAVRIAPEGREPVPPFVPVPGPVAAPVAELPRRDDLAFDNGLGGFAPDGSGYVIEAGPGGRTPQAWSNVLANDRFGTVVTEAGGGFSWAVNSGENRLTPWSNDPLADPPGEVIYLRDEETAALWSVTPNPCGAETRCRVTHSPGVTEWRRASHGLVQTLSVLVAPEAPVKLFVMSLENPGNHVRRVTATCYAEWVLGAVNETARPHVVCDYDPGSRALLARSAWNPEFAARTAFLTASHPPHSLTSDRRAFIGEAGRRDRPAGLLAWDLGGRVRDVTEPCAAYQVHLDLAPGATERVVFALGQGEGLADARALAAEWQSVERAEAARAEVEAVWARRLGAIEVRTPDPAFDLMVNRWLLYQDFASRILARSGFQQSGGAYGFRDQLQDMLAILHVDPDRVRAHLLECAAHQFEAGDVLHWWHPPSGRGVRTRCSDDLLWLPFVTARYVAATGDRSVLDERVAYLSAPELRPEEEDRYAVYETGEKVAPLFDHCLRALERGVTSGQHGLPLIGGGDWNDGMDAVGRHGRGESVWLAWFAAATAEGFADLAEGSERAVLAGLWRDRATQLRETADRAGWDGAWYMRAFDDDGIPWGSAENDECRIDSIAQSWSVLSGAEPAPHAREAMESLARHLIHPEARLVRLLSPPFDETPRNPGYIRAYPPGVRENGGQYTHAAAWAGLAFAALGDGDRAWQVFDIINPVRRTDTAAKAAHYRGEPYALPGDVLGAPPHTGRAGWTWYTGAAGWAWTLAVEGILGIRIVAGALDLRPCLPRDWPGAEATLSLGRGRLKLTIENPEGLAGGALRVEVDGAPWGGGPIPFPVNSERVVRARIEPQEATIG
ncbi:cellobiose phosphorylase [Rhodovulum iodosum]|nr:cellobiose phosphorylase [Rhodovulum robiginosum]